MMFLSLLIQWAAFFWLAFFAGATGIGSALIGILGVIGSKYLFCGWAHKVMNDRHRTQGYTLVGLLFMLIALGAFMLSAGV